MYNTIVELMTSNPLWGVAIGLFFLALPMVLVMISLSPPIIAFVRTYPKLSTFTTFVVGVGVTMYYWTVGIASFLLVLLSVLIYFKDVSLIF